MDPGAEVALIVAISTIVGGVTSGGTQIWLQRGIARQRFSERAEDRQERQEIADKVDAAARAVVLVRQAAEIAADHARAATAGIQSVAKDMKELADNTNHKMDLTIAAIKEANALDVARAGAEGELKGRDDQREKGNC